RAWASALGALGRPRVLPKERTHGLGHAGTVLHPLLHQRLVDLHLAGGGPIRAQSLEEASVAAAARVRRDDVVVGSLLGAGTGQPNVYRHRESSRRGPEIENAPWKPALISIPGPTVKASRRRWSRRAPSDPRP